MDMLYVDKLVRFSKIEFTETIRLLVIYPVVVEILQLEPERWKKKF